MTNKALYATIQNGRYVIEEPAPFPEGKRLCLVIVEEDEPRPRAKLRVSPSNQTASEFERLTPEQVREAMSTYARENAGLTDKDPELQEAGLDALKELT